MDSGFYRGTNSAQDVRFSDKEKKLLKQMKFENSLDSKVDLQKVNLDVIKPWITGKLNAILGLEDDVIVEYVFTQLEEKNINPKVMQINLTGFLNARRAREFMGELWQLLLEAQSSEDGIPISLIDKKMAELKSESGPSRDESSAKSTGSDWSNRYQALTGGRYGKSAPNYASELEVGGRGRNGPRGRRDYRDPDSPPIPRSRREAEAVMDMKGDAHDLLDVADLSHQMIIVHQNRVEESLLLALMSTLIRRVNDIVTGVPAQMMTESIGRKKKNTDAIATNLFELSLICYNKMFCLFDKILSNGKAPVNLLLSLKRSPPSGNPLQRRIIRFELQGMEDVSLAEIFEVRASGFSSAEILAILAGACECLIANVTNKLFTPNTLFITQQGRIRITAAATDDLPSSEFIPPELANGEDPKEPQLVWCLGEIAKRASLPDCADAGIFSLINLMTVSHVNTRPTLHKLQQIIRNKIANPESCSFVLTSLFKEIMGDVNELADDSDVESYISGISDGKPPLPAKLAANTVASRSLSSTPAGSFSSRGDSDDDNQSIRIEDAKEVNMKNIMENSSGLSRISEESIPVGGVSSNKRSSYVELSGVIESSLPSEDKDNHVNNGPESRNEAPVPVEVEIHRDSSRTGSPFNGRLISARDQNDEVKPVISDAPKNISTENLSRQNSRRLSHIRAKPKPREFSDQVRSEPELVEKHMLPPIRLTMRPQITKKKRLSLHRTTDVLVQVEGLNGQIFELNCRSDALVMSAFETIVDHLNITEHVFFGLALLRDDQYFFLNNDQRLEKFAPPSWKEPSSTGPIFLLHLRFKYYPFLIDFIRTDITIHELFLQLRRDVLRGNLGTADEMLQLTAIGIRAERIHFPSPSFNVLHFLPEWMLDSANRLESSKKLTNRIAELYIQYANWSADAAKRAFIRMCQSLTCYGSHFYKLHKLKPPKNKTELLDDASEQCIAIAPRGIGIYKGTLRQNQLRSFHEWHMIRTLQHDEKRFMIATIENNIAVDRVFYATHSVTSRYLVHFAAEQHRFLLRLRRIQKSMSKPMNDVGVDRSPNEEIIAEPENILPNPTMSSDYIRECYGSEAVKLNITLEKHPAQGLGLTLVDGSVNGMKGVYVKSVAKDGNSWKKGLNMGDCLLGLNDISLVGKSRHDVVNLVKDCQNEVKLEVLRFHSITAALNADNSSLNPGKDAAVVFDEPLPQKASKPKHIQSRHSTTPPPQPRSVPSASVTATRRQRAVSDFGAKGDTLPSMNSEMLLASMGPVSRRAASESSDDEIDSSRKGLYELPAASIYEFDRGEEELEYNKRAERRIQNNGF